MPRTALKTAQPVTDVALAPAAVASIYGVQDALTLQNDQSQAAGRAMAVQLGYQGDLSVGALEDGIRFYQRRTVEAILEMGKRMLVLREVTGNGAEFDQRLEMMGVSRSSAYRFMQAAAKTAKSENLAALSHQVKSAAAFLELVTHDEDTLKAVSELDDIDRMPATELRKALRQAHEDNKFIAEKRDKERQRADKLEKVLHKGPQALPLHERLSEFHTAVNGAADEGADALLKLQQQTQALERWWLEEAAATPGYDPEVATPMPPEVQAVAQKLYDSVERMVSNAASLREVLWASYGQELQAARTLVQD